jgi:hypothetical protein
MRIGTWNVEYGFGTRNPDRLELLRTHPADVWVLTETHPDLDLSATHVPVCSDQRPILGKVKNGSAWVTIWSRFPLLRPLSVPDRLRMVAALFDTPGGPLAVAGVVLPWHSDKGDQPAEQPPGNWSEHQRVLREQLPLLLRGLREQAPGAHRVLAGDFNTDLAPPHSYGIAAGRRALTGLLTEAVLVCHTANVFYPGPSPPRTLIDHICTDLGRTEAVETWAGEDGGQPRLSDHPGVVVTLGTEERQGQGSIEHPA